MKLLPLFFASLFLLSCNSDKTADSEKSGEADSASKIEGSTEIVIETSKGTIKAKLHPETAPITVANFLSYVDQKHYDGTIFHRIISNFMIQGGGFVLKNDVPTEIPTGKGIQNESARSKKNLRGTLAMARTPDPHSATAQFFINVVDNNGTIQHNLDHPESGKGYGYAVFGEVTEGMDIVDKIKMTDVGIGYLNSLQGDGSLSTNKAQNVPLLDHVIIKSIRRAPSS